MSKSRIVPYVVRYTDQWATHTAAWEERTGQPYNGQGRPTDAKAEAWRVAMNRTFRRGSWNEHIRPHGCIPHINKVEIYRQSDGKLVASAKMPLFEVA